MKKRNHILSIAILPLLMLSLQHCDDPLTELEKLPKATQSGKDTFGCLVDGRAWVMKTSNDANFYYQTGTLYMAAGLANHTINQEIVLGMFDLNVMEIEYSLNDYPQQYGILNDLKSNCEFFSSNAHVGKLKITHLDKANFIISGTFEFEAFSTTCNTLVKVTNGRFDMHYAP